MTNIEKMELLEECMDIDEGTLKMEDELNSFEEWDSVTALSVIAMVDEKFHKTLTGDDMKCCKTVADVVALMQES